jgi:hypothetical protein
MHTSIARRISILGIAALLAAGCADRARKPAQPEESKGTAVSSVEPPHTEFASKAVPLPRLPFVASRGGCEPRYFNGRTGSCINDQPCRGYGVLENERAVCMCYAVRGGCKEGYRCEARGAQCVKDDEKDYDLLH